MATLNLQKRSDLSSRALPNRGLQAAYDDTYLRVLIRNPGELFVFWECSPDAIRAAVKAADREGSGFQPVLRLFMMDSTSPCPQEVLDILIQEGEDSRYVPVPQPGRRYRIEYGFATLSGGFIPLCSSSEIRTPEATIHEPPAPVESVIKPGTDSATPPQPLPGLLCGAIGGFFSAGPSRVTEPGRLPKDLPLLAGSSMLGIPHSAFAKPATGVHRSQI
jgi:hypothetical protein